MPCWGTAAQARDSYPTGRRVSIGRGGLRCSLAYKLCHVVLARACCSVDIVRTIGGEEQVNMGVNETWQHRFSAQVYQFGMPVAHAAHFIVFAHSQDTPADSIDSHSLRSWLHGIHGIDSSIQIQYDAHRIQCLEIK